MMIQSQPEKNRDKYKKVLNYLGYGFYDFFSLWITGILLIIIILMIFVPSWILIYNWGKFSLEDYISASMFIVSFIILIFCSSFCSIYGIKRIKAKIKRTKYKLPTIPKIASIITAMSLILIILNFPSLEFQIDQYKKIGRDQITIITNGNPKYVIYYADAYLKSYPEDLEANYLKAVAYSKLNNIDNAMSSIQDAMDLGLPFERFLAGPRTLMDNLYNSQEFQALKNSKNIKLIHGPVLGNITANNASFWVRTSDELSVSIKFSDNIAMTGAKQSETLISNSENDYTVIISIGQLIPETQYYYQVIVDGGLVDIDPLPSFKTYPNFGDSSVFSIGFGGGAGFTPQHEYMWNTISSHNLDSFLLLGDNVYIDTPDVPETQQYCYYRRQSRTEYRNFSASTPIYAIWDDHDFGTNDCTSSQDINNPTWKMSVLDIFKENFVNPSYGGDNNNPGVYFNFSIGDVDFIMLDCRFYRQNPKEFSNPSMIGPIQKQWLLNTIGNSTATFKIIASSVPWAPGTKPGSLDTWDGFPEEREEIFSFIETEGIDGVVLLSADRHRSDAWKIERENGYDFYDFMSSKLTNIHTHNLMDGALFGYNEKCSFGKLSFNTTAPDPELIYEIYNIDNELIYRFELKKSQLT